MTSLILDWIPSTLASFEIKGDGTLSVEVSIWAGLGLVALAYLIYRVSGRGRGALQRVGEFEIDEATIGVGAHKFKLKPNDTDRQIAFAIWVELSTRKLGLPIDPDHDIIEEVYNSWYQFFGIARGLIRDVPISKVREEGTLKIVEMSLQVLNGPLRSHLTRWQGRYRHWLDTHGAAISELSPQERQAQFPEYDALLKDMLEVNRRLQNYRKVMYELAVKS